MFGALTEETTLLIRILGVDQFKTDADVVRVLDNRVQDL